MCYSHDDAAVVFRDIEWLNERGYRIWYDEGIPLGTEWREELAQRIKNAALFLFFVSPHSVASVHCRRETHFALDERVPMLVVYVDETLVPDGLRLSLNDRQAISRYDAPKERYRELVTQAIDRHVVELGPPAPKLPAPASRRWRRMMPAAALATVVVAALATGGWYWYQREHAGELDPPTIAVVPFENSTGDASLDVVARGLVEDIIDNLDGHKTPLVASTPTVADTLRYGYLLKGNLRRAGANLQLTTQLIRAVDRYSVWSQPFERTREEVVNTHDLAKTVAFHARVRVLQDDGDRYWLAHPGENDPRAIESYQRGMEAYRKLQNGGGGSWETITSLFQRAIAIDPSLYLGQLLLADAYANRAGWDVPIDVARRDGYAALNIALELQSADWQAALGYCIYGKLLLIVDLDYDAAIDTLRRGFALDPENACIIGWLGSAYRAAGKQAESDAAWSSVEHSVDVSLDPRETYVLRRGQGLTAHGRNDFVEAIRWWEEALRLTENPRMRADCMRGLAMANARLGRIDVARDLIERAWRIAGHEDPQAFVAPYALTGQMERARELMSRWNERDQFSREMHGSSSHLDAIGGYLALGDAKATIRWLRNAVRDRDLSVFWLRTSQTWEPLRSDPQWAELMHYLEQSEAESREAGRKVRARFPALQLPAK